MTRRRHRPLPPRHHFHKHLARAWATALAILVFSLGIGMAGLMYTEQLPLTDAFLFAAMILTGMGPTTPLTNEASKLFVASYAIFSGVFFLIFAAVAVGPVLQRFLHKFHLDLEEEEP
ncbi:MAG: hypothetical protein Q8P18_22435 [Pseudomonadota bacterium]|nr:hypothetical protein [Pseudomonadota bacterium]